MKKLRNKITGEINEFMVHKRIEDSEDGNPVYAPFDGHIDEWQDYEEPKSGIKDVWFPDVIEGRNNVVISFETREEAKNAVRKLKAWKRLKELGFRFIDWELDMKTVADGKIWFDVGINTEWYAERLL